MVKQESNQTNGTSKKTLFQTAKPQKKTQMHLTNGTC
jgi:hypothetical protein